MALLVQYGIIVLLCVLSAMFVVKHSGPSVWAAAQLRVAVWLHQERMPAFCRRLARRIMAERGTNQTSCDSCSGCDQ